MSFKQTELTREIIGAFYQVYNALGYGFLEKVYENALAIQLRERGLNVEQQKPIHVYYKTHLIGEYYADLIVNDLVIVELKAFRTLAEEHKAQILNYLKATHYEVGLLFNFGPKPEYKRFAYNNENKPNLQ